jgi:hypothetical protein
VRKQLTILVEKMAEEKSSFFSMKERHLVTYEKDFIV